jgi:putative ABC transport system permease protein
MDRMHLRLYRGLLILYPAEFRDEYGREMCLAFADQWREQGSAAGRALVWIHAALGVLAEAPKEHYHVMMQDLRHAIRVMRKDAAVTAAAIAILALGIGSTTAVFSLVNGILVRPLPFPAPDRIVAAGETSAASRLPGAIAFPNYQDIRARTRLLTDIGLYVETTAVLRGEREAENLRMGYVTDGIFNVLRVKPMLGHAITREEDVPNGPKIVLLSHDLWQRRFGSDPNIIGKTLPIGSAQRTVTGVMPASFHFPERAEIWMPLQLSPKESKRTDYWLEGIARLRPGVSAEQASAELASLMKQINSENPITTTGSSATAVPIRDTLAGEYRAKVMILLGAVGFLLLIACANITNLLLVKGSVRTREMAVRAALGASRTRLIRQLVTESILFGLLGGAVGIALAYAAVPAILSMVPVDLPRWMSFSIDPKVLGFAFGLSLLTSLVFGIAPALGASRVELTAALKEGGRAGTAGSRRRFVRNGLVVAEVALSLTLLAGAGLMVRSFLALRTQSLGFQPSNLLTMDLNYPAVRYRGAGGRANFDRLHKELAGIPGVNSIAFSSGVPLSSAWGRSLTVEGYPVLPLKDAPMINHTVAMPGYFRTMGVPIIEGRDFTDSDWDQPRVTIIDQALAKKYWPSESPVGKRIRFGPPESNEPWHTVIGVAGVVRSQNLNGQNRWDVYIPFSNNNAGSSIAIRTSGDPMTLAQSVRARIIGFDRDISVSNLFSEEQVLDHAAWRERFFAVLFTVFSVLALLLAAVGVYGVLAYAVSLRKHEIGIRMALGASGGQVQRMVMRQGLLLTGVGLIIGTAAASGLTRLLTTQLFQVKPNDPVTFVTVIGVLVAVAAVASFVTALRATRVDPAIALREE